MAPKIVAFDFPPQFTTPRLPHYCKVSSKNSQHKMMFNVDIIHDVRFEKIEVEG